MKYITDIGKISGLSEKEKTNLKKVTDKYEFKVNDYYLSLIDWKNKKDPIRRIVIPELLEMDRWGSYDPSKEKSNLVMPGMQHKYRSTALLLVSGTCGSICRFCFRKRIFIKKGEAGCVDINKAAAYIKKHKEITNVLLTGGDPLMLPTRKLSEIIGKLRKVKTAQIIRIGTKMPAYNPDRILKDPSFAAMVRKYSEDERKIYFMVHFNHPRELTPKAIKALNVLIRAGAIMANQTPLLRGINDNVETLARLLRKLSFMGVPPYYVFQCRPTLANKDFAVPVEEGYRIFEKAKSHCSGLAKRAKFVMSHATGKIEVVGLTEDRIFFKYHRAKLESNSSKFVIAKRNPKAYWFDDYKELIRESRLE